MITALVALLSAIIGAGVRVRVNRHERKRQHDG
jgi:hypothetical protein